MLEFPKIAVDYWNELLDGEAIMSGSDDFVLTANPALDHRRRVMLLQQGGMRRAAITPEIAQAIALPDGTAMSEDAFREALRSADIRLHDPDLVFYYCSPPPSPSALSSDIVVRALTAADANAFAAFHRQASEADKEDAFVELDHWAVFGVFDGDALLTAASIYPWGNAQIADLGVLTLPSARGKGHAKAAVRAISQHALDLGYQPQYRCQHDNLGSIALARSAGLILWGMWEVVQDDD